MKPWEAFAAGAVGLGAGVAFGVWFYRSRTAAVRAAEPSRTAVLFEGSYGGEDATPAARVPVRLRAPERPGEGLEVVALVDTGAALSVVPKEHVERLQLPRVGEILVRGVTGTERVGLYAADWEIGGVRFVEQVAGVGEEVLLGRNLLNRWVMLLDGPRKWFLIASGSGVVPSASGS